MTTSPRVAVICAHNRRNSGMASVDLSAACFLDDRGIDFDLFMALPTTIAASFRGRRIGVYSDVRQLDGYSHVLFWGDFLNNPVYGRRDFSNRRVREGVAPDRRTAVADWRRLMMLSGGVRPGQRVGSIGGNFQHDFSHAEVADLALMTANFHRILPRDPVSLKNLAHHLPAQALPALDQGMDPAFLLPPEPAADPQAQFVWSFGRSSLPDPDALVRAAAAATGLEARELPAWLDNPPEDSLNTLIQMRRTIAASRFVLTDIYHLAVNALSQGVPVLLIARPRPVQEGTLGDYKKLTLMEMLGLGQWLLRLPRARDDGAPEMVAALAPQVAAFAGDPQPFALTRALAARFAAEIEAFISR